MAFSAGNPRAFLSPGDYLLRRPGKRTPVLSCLSSPIPPPFPKNDYTSSDSFSPEKPVNVPQRQEKALHG